MERTALRHSERGMTLIEIIVVIVLISVVFTIVASNIVEKGDSAKAKLNTVKMEQLKQYIGQYRLEYNSYPSKLRDLVKKSSDIKDKMFVPLAKEEDLNDVWGFPYIYKTENSGRTYSLSSLGADGIEGGDGAKQDITMRP